MKQQEITELRSKLNISQEPDIRKENSISPERNIVSSETKANSGRHTSDKKKHTDSGKRPTTSSTTKTKSSPSKSNSSKNKPKQILKKPSPISKETKDEKIEEKNNKSPESNIQKDINYIEADVNRLIAQKCENERIETELIDENKVMTFHANQEETYVEQTKPEGKVEIESDKKPIKNKTNDAKQKKTTQTHSITNEKKEIKPAKSLDLTHEKESLKTLVKEHEEIKEPPKETEVIEITNNENPSPEPEIKKENISEHNQPIENKDQDSKLETKENTKQGGRLSGYMAAPKFKTFEKLTRTQKVSKTIIKEEKKIPPKHKVEAKNPVKSPNKKAKRDKSPNITSGKRANKGLSNIDIPHSRSFSTSGHRNV